MLTGISKTPATAHSTCGHSAGCAEWTYRTPHADTRPPITTRRAFPLGLAQISLSGTPLCRTLTRKARLWTPSGVVYPGGVFATTVASARSYSFARATK